VGHDSLPDTPISERSTLTKNRQLTDTLELALTASGCRQARVAHKPRLLSDNGSSYVSGDLAKWLTADEVAYRRRLLEKKGRAWSSN
jgi:transposase InsO family protein